MHRNLGQYERAIQDYDEAIRLIPQMEAFWKFLRTGFLEASYALAYYLRGLVYEELGKSTEAELDIAKAKELGYDP